MYNMKQGVNELASSIMVVEADDYDEVAEISEGNIAAVSGLKVSFLFLILWGTVLLFGVQTKLKL